MNVFITIDTEISSIRTADWRETHLAAEIQRDIFGHTANGDFGITYEMDVMNAFGLKSTVFLESLFASVVGIEPLRRIVEAIRTRGHDVQLHAHPDWLCYLKGAPPRTGAECTMCSFTVAEQVEIIQQAQENLRRCGVTVSAFRAGDFDANCDTLTALRASGI